MKKYRISRNNMPYGQMGMQQPSQEEMMMMQQQSQQQPAPQQDPQKQLNQLAQQISTVVQKGEDPATIAQQLMENVPANAVGQAFQMLLEQGVIDESDMKDVAQVLMSSQGEQQQAQPSEEEMMAMQQQQAAPQQPPMARAGYIRMRQKARAGMSVDQEAASGSATNLIADTNMEKNALLKFTQDNVAANQFGQEYDQMYAGGSLEQARYGRGKARRAIRRASRDDRRAAMERLENDPNFRDTIMPVNNDNFAKNNSRRSRQLARRAVREMPDVYSRADRKALREGLESGEFDKYDVYRGVDVFNPQSKPGYPKVEAGSWNSTMIPGKDWGMQPSAEEDMPAEEMVEETSTESNVIADFDNAYDYKKENGIIYTRKKGAADWMEVDPESSAGISIRKKVYGETGIGNTDEDTRRLGYRDQDQMNELDGDTEPGDPIGEDLSEYDENGNPIVGNDGQPCLEYPGESSGQTFAEWAAELPYDEFGMYTTNCGEVYNRTNLPGYNRENINARVPGGSAAYPMEFGGQYADDGLEMARFGRGRARRQARRAARQGRRAMRQADRAMRSVYGNIAFPPGVSPMMAGMPLMGPNGAGSDMMQFYGKRGLLGGLREFSMNMPVNFGRGMFFNGMFNPFGMQGGYNDMRYKITYPGQESEVTAEEEAKKEVEGAEQNQKLEDDTKQKGQQEKEEKEGEEANNTDNTTEEKDENGISKNCGENAFVNEAGQCNCNEGYIRNPNVKTFSCISEAELAAMEDEEKPEGQNWVYIAVGGATLVGGIAGGIWVLKKLAPKVRALISKNPAASKTAREALLKQIVNQFPNGTQVASGTKLLGPGASIPQTSITGTKMTEAELRASREAAETAAQQATRGEAQVIKGAIEGSGPRALIGNMNVADRALINTQRIAQEGIDRAALEKLAQKNGIQNIAGKKTGELLRELRLIANPGITPPLTRNAPKILSNAQKQVLKAELAAAEKSTAAAARKLAQKYGVKVAANASKKTIMKVLRKALPIFQIGGPVNPNLYMFTGGGAPDYVDYFADGGYYGDGGYYEDVYDPYMPMAGNGITMVDRPYQTAAQYGNEYAPYPGPYAEPMITDSIRRSVIDSGRLIDDITGEEIIRSTVGPMKRGPQPTPREYGGYQEGDVVDMTEAELGAFLMAGGQVEFVD